MHAVYMRTEVFCYSNNSVAILFHSIFICKNCSQLLWKHLLKSQLHAENTRVTSAQVLPVQKTVTAALVQSENKRESDD